MYVITNFQEKNNFIDTVKLLLEHGPHPNVAHMVNIGYREEKWVQRTALHKAAYLGLTEVVEMLLDAGGKCATSNTSQTPLALALSSNFVLQSLLSFC